MMLFDITSTCYTRSGLDLAHCINLPVFNDPILIAVIGVIGIVLLIKLVAYVLQSIPL